jgi:hypothetical protein
MWFFSEQYSGQPNGGEGGALDQQTVRMPPACHPTFCTRRSSVTWTGGPVHLALFSNTAVVSRKVAETYVRSWLGQALRRQKRWWKTSDSAWVNQALVIKKRKARYLPFFFYQVTAHAGHASAHAAFRIRRDGQLEPPGLGSCQAELRVVTATKSAELWRSLEAFTVELGLHNSGACEHIDLDRNMAL